MALGVSVSVFVSVSVYAAVAVASIIVAAWVIVRAEAITRPWFGAATRPRDEALELRRWLCLHP